jgi:hypothetical protein
MGNPHPLPCHDTMYEYLFSRATETSSRDLPIDTEVCSKGKCNAGSSQALSSSAPSSSLATDNCAQLVPNMRNSRQLLVSFYIFRRLSIKSFNFSRRARNHANEETVAPPGPDPFHHISKASQEHCQSHADAATHRASIRRSVRLRQ